MNLLVKSRILTPPVPFPEPGNLSLEELLSFAVARLNYYRQVARQRRQLLTLSDEMLKDIGLSRADALAEAKKPFWK